MSKDTIQGHNPFFGLVSIPLQAFRDERLSLEGLGLFGWLCSHERTFTVSHGLISSRFGVGAHKRQKLIRELKDLGYLRVEATRGKHGRIEGWTWELINPGARPEGGSTRIRKSGNSDSPEVGFSDLRLNRLSEDPTLLEDKNILREEDKNSKKEEEYAPSAPAPSEYSEDFETFWKAWRQATRKARGKRAAFAEWKRLGKAHPGLQALLDDVSTRSVYDKRWLAGFIKDPQRYLKDRQWEDDLDDGKPRMTNNDRAIERIEAMEASGLALPQATPGFDAFERAFECDVLSPGTERGRTVRRIGRTL